MTDHEERRAFEELVKGSFTAQEREELDDATDQMLFAEFTAFSRGERDLLWAFANEGYDTTGPAWAAIEAHPHARQLAGFLWRTPAFRRGRAELEEED